MDRDEKTEGNLTRSNLQPEAPRQREIGGTQTTCENPLSSPTTRARKRRRTNTGIPLEFANSRGTPSNMSLQNLQGGQLSVRGVNFQVPTNQGARDHVHEAHGKESWRYKTLAFVHQTWVQRTLMTLLFLDVLILFTELFLLGFFPSCHFVERDCIGCCASNAVEHDDALGRVLAQGGDDEYHGHEEGVCEAGYEPIGIGACDAHKWHRVHTAEQALFGLTIVILSVFMVELHVEMIALGPCIFFRQIFFTVDYVVVLVSLVFELFFHLVSEDVLQSLVGLFVALRIWRFVRIGHGIVEIASEVTHEQYTELLAYAEEMEQLLQQHTIALPETSKSIVRAHHILDLLEEDPREDESSERSRSNDGNMDEEDVNA